MDCPSTTKNLRTDENIRAAELPIINDRRMKRFWSRSKKLKVVVEILWFVNRHLYSTRWPIDHQNYGQTFCGAAASNRRELSDVAANSTDVLAGRATLVVR